MKRKTYNANLRFLTAITVVTLAVTLVCLITGSYLRQGYNIKPGSVSDFKIKATRQVENKVATQRLKDEAENAVQPLFRREQQISAQVVQRLDHYFEEMDRLRKENTPIFTPTDTGEDGVFDDEIGEYVAPEIENESGILPSIAIVGGLVQKVPSSQANSSVSSAYNSVPNHTEAMKSVIESSFLAEDFSYEELRYVVNLDTSSYNIIKNNVYKTVSDALEAGVKEESLVKTLVDMKNEFEKMYQAIDMRFAEASYEISAAFMASNFIYDEEATLKQKAERRNEVEPIYYLPGQTIVDEGAIVTQEAYAAIESLGLLSKGLQESIAPVIGVTGIFAFIFLFSYIYIYYFCDRLMKNAKEALMLAFIYLVVILAARFIGTVNIWLLVPVLIFTMLTAVLLDVKLALVLNMGVTIITMLITNSGMDYLFYFLIAGTIAAQAARYLNQRSNVFIVCLMVSISSGAIYLFIALMYEKAFSTDLVLHSLYAFLYGILTVMMVMGSLPLWEALFGVVTQIKLLDLTNPDNELLRRLTIEAPGTYHHSLIVANLSETAAYDIGADPNIARVGGYYHDIGKLKFPQYFSENQIGKNPHDDLDPYSSVAVITSHIAIGLQMADEKRLPKVIKDIISQHHGNSLVKYFLYKVKNENPDDAVNEADFRYKHSPPGSKEAAVVMLADTVEAAVRSMFSKSKSMEEIEKFTKELIKDKLDDGQLIESELTIKDLDTISASFMRVFNGMYHERIPYPKNEKK